MLEQLTPEQAWNGIHFSGSASQEGKKAAAQFHFHRRADGVRCGFSAKEWRTLRELFATAMGTPRLQAAFAELALVYGEL